MRDRATIIQFRRRAFWRRFYDRWGIAPLYLAAIVALALVHLLLRLL